MSLMTFYVALQISERTWQSEVLAYLSGGVRCRLPFLPTLVSDFFTTTKYSLVTIKEKSVNLMRFDGFDIYIIRLATLL